MDSAAEFNSIHRDATLRSRFAIGIESARSLRINPFLHKHSETAMAFEMHLIGMISLLESPWILLESCWIRN
jgi:hypothetical protein